MRGRDAVRLDRFDILDTEVSPASGFITADVLTVRQAVLAMPSATARLLFILWSIATTVSQVSAAAPDRIIIYDSYWMKHTARRSSSARTSRPPWRPRPAAAPRPCLSLQCPGRDVAGPWSDDRVPTSAAWIPSAPRRASCPISARSSPCWKAGHSARGGSRSTGDNLLNSWKPT
ncbi:hypothetical protein ACRAWD_31850 [Caulobacter segnis]